MNNRTRSIAGRGRLVFVFIFLALLFPILLNGLGVANYDSERSGDDPSRPADLGLAERICLVSEWMSLGCFLVWVAAQFRVRYNTLFEDRQQGVRVLPLIFGPVGLALLLTKWARWGSYTGGHFAISQGWQFGVGWFLLWWSLVFFGWDPATAQKKEVLL